MVKWLRRLLPVLLVVTLFTGCGGATSPTTTGTKVGQAAPDFRLNGLDGKAVSLSDFRGQAVVLNFWSRDCPPCRAEAPVFQRFYEAWTGKGVALLTVNADAAERAQEYMAANSLSFPVLLDSGDIFDRYGIQYIPTTYFLDRDGVIQGVQVGSFPDQTALEDRLRELKLIN